MCSYGMEKEYQLQLPFRQAVAIYWQGFRQKKIYGGGGQLENTNLLKKGICLLNTFLKDFTKMPIKKTLFCSLMGGYPPLAKIMRGINPPRPPLCMKPWLAQTLNFTRPKTYFSHLERSDIGIFKLWDQFAVRWLWGWSWLQGNYFCCFSMASSLLKVFRLTLCCMP